jgi:hypothetical protein
MGRSTDAAHPLTSPATPVSYPSGGRTDAHFDQSPESEIKPPRPSLQSSDLARFHPRDKDHQHTPASLEPPNKQCMGPHQEALTHQTPTPKSPRPLSCGSAPPSCSLALPVLVDPGFAQASFRGKGFGLKATRDFAPGEEIITEAPFVSFRLDDDDVEQAFNYLSGPARLLFLSFTPTINNPNISLYRNIAETNALTCWNQDDAKEYVDADADVNEENDGDSILKRRLGGSSTAPIDLTAMSDDDIDMGEAPVKPAKSIGICENICRVNHSCRPNSGWAWDRATSQMGEIISPASPCMLLNGVVLYAYNTIAANEEITASYHNAYNILPRAQRRAKLLEKFGFDCMCQACSPID